ncbi:hypothetical protein [Mycolicibacterium tusciae]|uniref:Ryanodine receptor Ryr domain-containing protein n=1 Tax=Mycolicibacterium tusciae TaxID=75922 RepID=A0A1X0K0W6_9MYCO|nr:hypothetical protein [Mycolicibacterium tusciae]ORB68783.1 hypothetical protein BST47_02530 [Mycolicibacterium tusciae]
MRVARGVQISLLALSLLLVGYLVLLAFRPYSRPPEPFDWFGKPADWRTILIVTAVLALLCIVSYRVRQNRTSATVPVAIVVGLFAVGFVLGLGSYWNCSGAVNPTFFTALQWTVSLVKGGLDEKSLREGVCPVNPPVALDIARMAILAAFAVSIVGVATSVFRQQADRFRAGFARSVTAVVDVDDDAQSMVNAIARTSERNSTLVLITTTPDSPVIQECRTLGARVLRADFNRPETVGMHRLWRHLDRLYLLSSDPSSNLSRLRVINHRLAQAGHKRRLPLILRIDDPWLAKGWRAEQLGGSDTRWAADAVGTYEVTARRLIDHIVEMRTIRRVFVCGSSQLTLALCADMARRQLEHDFHPSEEDLDLPRLTLVTESAEEFRHDYEFHEARRGFGENHLQIEAVEEVPSQAVLSRLIRDDERNNAVIFVDSIIGPTTGTRLAARFPNLLIYMWDSKASVAAEALPIVGKLHHYRLGIDLPSGQAHDNWERAAILIHERFAASTRRDTPATVPWEALDDFYRDSNRRQVRNALWMVEQLAGHTWNTWASPPDQISPSGLRDKTPIEQLRLLGFEDDASYAMARGEWESWRRYYIKAGWKYGPERDYGKKIHEKLVADWAATKADPKLLEASLRSLSTTLIHLRELGYRSQPLWRPYRRVGVVSAKRRWTPWTWRASSGDTMRAGLGDWEVHDAEGEIWSVRNDVFRSSYRRGTATVWEACGIVLARPARTGETIDTLEGPERAKEGDWIIQGDAGEQWPVTTAKFESRYQGPVSFSERYEALPRATRY